MQDEAKKLIHRVCVLILNYQTYQDTVSYVERLRRQKDIDLRILIVDNASPNGSFEILKEVFHAEKDIDVLSSGRNGGYAYGNNYGLKRLTDEPLEYVVISNNDVIIDDENLISKLIKAYDELDKPAFVSPIMHNNGKQAKYAAWKLPTLRDDLIGSLRCSEKFFRNKVVYKTIDRYQTQKVECLPGSFFMGKKEIFFRLGLMDENTFLYMEECILAHKAKKLGLYNYLIGGTEYEHSISKTISSELSLTTMRTHLISSRIYFHKAYLGTNALGIAALRLLFVMWKLETFFYLRIQRATGNKKRIPFSKKII